METDHGYLDLCCGCLLECDGEKRISACLKCHHRICISCVKDTKQRLGRIVCPRCQYSPAPNEAPFILILSLQQENDERLLNTLIREFQPQQESQIWCVKCVSVAKKECLEKHYTVDMTSKTATDCLELKQALVRFKSQAKIPLQKRQERKMKLNEILRCLKVVETDIQNQLNENNERISQLISMADGVLENSSPEPFHVLKSRLELANQLSDEELLKVKEVEAAEQSEKSMEFWFQFETSGGRIIESLPYSSNIGTASSSSANITTSTEDFETNTGILNCQKTLMSHLIVSSLRKQGRTSAPARENVKVEMNPIRPPVRPISPPPSARRPQYRFVVQAHTGRILTGEFAFEPSANLDATFLRHLVKCFRNRQEEHYSTQLTHTAYDGAVVMDFSHQKLNFALPGSMKELARNALDVGVIPLKTSKNNFKLRFVFFLKSVNSLPKSIEQAYLLGKLTLGSSAVAQLSRKRVFHRVSFTWSVIEIQEIPDV